MVSFVLFLFRCLAWFGFLLETVIGRTAERKSLAFVE